MNPQLSQIHSVASLVSVVMVQQPRSYLSSKLTATAAAGTLTAKWQAPAAVSGAAAVTGYLVTVSPGAHKQTGKPTVLTASVAKLKAGTYTVTVVAVSKAGDGPPATAKVKVAA